MRFNRILAYSALFLTALLITGCGGGGTGGSLNPDQGIPPTTTTSTSTTSTSSTSTSSGTGGSLNPDQVIHKLKGNKISNGKYSSDHFFYANPRLDLPQDDSDGLRVTRPSQGGWGLPVLSFADDLNDRLEPNWRSDPAAQELLLAANWMFWRTANQAYMQWTRHLDYNPGLLLLQIGDTGNLSCHNQAIACYLPDLNAVVLSDAWVKKIYTRSKKGILTYFQTDDWSGIEEVYEELFYVLSHESGHQFGYSNPNGITVGCGGHDRCHAPYKPGQIGSLISYNILKGDSAYYNVREEDIRYIDNATWNPNSVDRYEVSKAGMSSSINSCGVWIDHSFVISGQTDPGSFSGDLIIDDTIEATGWVHGRPSENVSLDTSATWSGEDNFLGVNLDPAYLGVLLRADAELHYRFDTQNMRLNINDFEAHYYDTDREVSRWFDHNFSDWGEFEYDMDCTTNGCSFDIINVNVGAKWYPDDSGDPSAYVGGVVNDRPNAYVGSFVAEKE